MKKVLTDMNKMILNKEGKGVILNKAMIVT
jgi:hypothetical protein